MMPGLRSALAVLAGCAPIGCGGSFEAAAVAPSDARLSALHVEPGEYIAWEVHWMGILVGTVETATGAEGALDGHRVILMRSRATSDGALAVLRRGTLELTTWLDLGTGRALAQAASIDPIASGQVLGARMKRERWGKRPFACRLAGGEIAHNPHSLLAALRAWRPVPGRGATAYLRGRHRLLRIDLAARGTEMVRTRLGRWPAQRIDGVLRPVGRDFRATGRSRAVSIWLDDTDHRIPVRIEVRADLGTLRLDLVEYRAGAAELAQVVQAHRP